METFVFIHFRDFYIQNFKLEYFIYKEIFTGSIINQELEIYKVLNQYLINNHHYSKHYHLHLIYFFNFDF
jgi:hypothetical protein